MSGKADENREVSRRLAQWIHSVFFVLLMGATLAACDFSPFQSGATKFQGMVIGEAGVGAGFGRDFLLNDPSGQVRRLADYRGKAVVLFFGYTQCPDVCPTMLSTMAEVMSLLGEEARRVQVLFVTLDPQRDTPALLANYVPRFHPSFIGLSGDTAATAAVAEEFRVYFVRHPGPDGAPESYSLDHTANSYLFDPQGHLRLAFKQGASAEALAADLRLLLAGK